MRAVRSLALLLVVLVAAPPVAAQVVVVPELPIDLEVPHGFFVPTGPFDVAGGADGRALLVWTERSLQGLGTSTPRQIVSRTIALPLGTLGPVASDTVKSVEPIVAAGGSGDAYLTAAAVGPQNFDRELIVRAFDETGASLGEAAAVSRDLMKSYGVLSTAVARNGSGFVVAWARRGFGVFATLVGREGIVGTEIDVDPLGFSATVDVARTPDGGFVVAWTPAGVARAFTQAGAPKAGQIELPLGNADRLEALAASPTGDVLAALILVGGESFSADAYPLVVQRFTSMGVMLGGPVLVHELVNRGAADAAFDASGNLHVVWADSSTPVRARTLDQVGVPVGPAIDVGGAAGQNVTRVATAALSDGTFLDVWPRTNELHASVVSLCVPGTSVCGDGVLDPLCERCDDGIANDDVVPDACRTTCRLPACGDGVTDAGEACDDGNVVDCDGCSAACTMEVGLGCGDGVALPRCGEVCDDGDADDGDGCTPTCTLERAPGGGSPTTDCYAAWSIDNPSNDPRFDEPDHINARQRCVDDDPRCDFDGGVPGTCTFRVRVCVNNTDEPACEPGTRLASWELRKPSAAQAANRPALGIARAAVMAAVLPNVVGPTARDVCSPFADVVVPMRGSAPRFKAGKLVLATLAKLYSGASDGDKLRLECIPGE